MKSIKPLISILIFSIFPFTSFAAPVLASIVPIPFYLKLKEDKKDKKPFPYNQIASFYPAKSLANYMMCAYERQVGAKHVLKIGAGYCYFEEQSSSFNHNLTNYSGTRFDIMLKYFIGKESEVFNGSYIGPFFSVKNSNFKYNTSIGVWDEGSAASYTGGFIIGYQTTISKYFVLDMYLGNVMQKSSGDYQKAHRPMDTYQNSIGVTAGISVGFGF